MLLHVECRRDSRGWVSPGQHLKRSRILTVRRYTYLAGPRPVPQNAPNELPTRITDLRPLVLEKGERLHDKRRAPVYLRRVNV